MKQITSKIVKTAPVNWKKLKPIQGEKFKDLSAESYKKLKTSLIKNNFIAPFAVWQDKDKAVYTIDGVHRQRVLTELESEGYDVPEALPANFIECKNRKEAAKMLLVYSSAYARTTESGLSEFLDLEDLKLDEIKFEIDIPGLDFDAMFKDNKLTDEELDSVPEPPKEAVSRLGDIFLIDGKHRVMCGDSTKKEDVEKLMDGKKADMVFTSPPYNAGKSEKLSGNTHTDDNKYQNGYNDNKTEKQWAELIKGTLLIVMQYSEYQFYNIQMLAGNKSAFLKILGDYSEQIVDLAIWNKGHGAPAMASNVMNSAFEFIVIFSGKTNPSRSIKIGNFRGTVKNIFDIPPQRNNEFSKIHAATFPVALPVKILSDMTFPSRLIIDNFLGTGTTLIACEQTNRICYGMEIDPVYIDVILKRYHTLYPDKEIKCLNRKADIKGILNA